MIFINYVLNINNLYFILITFVKVLMPTVNFTVWGR